MVDWQSRAKRKSIMLESHSGVCWQFSGERILKIICQHPIHTAITKGFSQKFMEMREASENIWKSLNVVYRKAIRLQKWIISEILQVLFAALFWNLFEPQRNNKHFGWIFQKKTLFMKGSFFLIMLS